MSAMYPQRPGEQDCRDYLRTGRCKYGESCKFNHPPNVENGGGVKAIDPTEPLYPVRPGEPTCQYFSKHGTCKFGQSCRFNHPTDSSLMDRGIPSGHLVFVTTTNNSSPAIDNLSSHIVASSTSVQILPQRPTEPSCIFFLRNRKCKYGATCKFHHPVDALNRNNHTTIASNNTGYNYLANNVATTQIQQHGLTYASETNGLLYDRLHPITESVRSQQQQHTHILLPDGQIAVILDQQSLQDVSELSAQDRPKYYMSQTDGSIGSKYQNSNGLPAAISPMLTATTHSTSNTTFESCIDLNSGYYHTQSSPRSRPKSDSIGSLSSSTNAYSIGEHDLGVSQLNIGHTSFPHYSILPQGQGQSSQAQVQRTLSYAESVESQHISATNVDRTAERTASCYWPSNESLSSIPNTDHTIQEGLIYDSVPTFTPYGSSNSLSQATHQSSIISQTVSSNQMRDMHSNNEGRMETSAHDDGLTMMTSALLTMMDRHDSSSGLNGTSSQPSQSLSQPPGMSHLSNENYRHSTQVNQTLNPPSSIPDGDGYLVGGCEESMKSPPWGLYREDL